ncbi:helix-turn-helix transcriptional regulator [Gordonibacter sp. An230]|uniref:helix-turn-helix transcriptional regulator n=1 Tax=Gordonibacter sp. An230 TaxID=1965592 RepID=UPI000B391CEC|nr:LuxR C-terminal-related transcriptional regulator [Gordonibacter sp. An230]OUO87593.1 helix-turn-helix transcriptional regulator [Gordonibacter sp. An230]
MQLQSIVRIFTPSITTLGYALFLAINAAGVWGGVFPFLPLEFQTPQIVFWFFFAQSVVFSASYFASMIGGYFVPGPTRTFIVRLATVPYLLGWCCLIGAIYLSDWSLPLVVAGGALLGLGSAGFYMLWQRLFASQDADSGNRELILGTAWAAVLYFSLYLIPQAVTAFLIPLVFLPLFGLTIALKSRTIDRDQAMFQDVPREHPRVYRRVAHDYWRSALCVGALGFCTGIMRSLAIGEPAVGSLVNALSMGGMCAAAIALLVLWQFKNLRLNVVGAYRVFFPIVITGFLMLPFLPEGYVRWLAAILYAVYSVAIMLMMIQCAQASRDRGINPVFIYGFFGGIVYALHDVGFIGGTFAEQIMVMGVAPLAVVALVAVYLLGLMYFIGQGGFVRIFKRDVDNADAAASIELVALRAPHASGRKSETGRSAQDATPNATTDSERKPQPVESQGTPKSQRRQAARETSPANGANAHAQRPRRLGPEERVYQDRISKQAAALQQHYRLSAREAEVMELIARGNTVARIAEDLVVSENTIRTHSKRIYAKLDIHKKQELLDLIESFDPSELED